jgi:hypothetical protein
MKQDPALCRHGQISKSVKIDKITIPELDIEQLVLKVRAYCKHCKEPFVMKTIATGFSTEEIGWLDGELIIPIDYPVPEDEITIDPAAPEELIKTSTRQSKDDLH